MATISSNNFAVISPPIELRWLGFRGVTHQMQRMGWEFVVERDEYRLCFTVAMKHQRDKVYGVSETIDDRHMMMRRYKDRLEKIGPIEVTIASELIINDRTFIPVNMHPVFQYEDEIDRSIEPMSIEWFFNMKPVIPNGKKAYKPATDSMKRRLDILVGDK